MFVAAFFAFGVNVSGGNIVRVLMPMSLVMVVRVDMVEVPMVIARAPVIDSRSTQLGRREPQIDDSNTNQDQKSDAAQQDRLVKLAVENDREHLIMPEQHHDNTERTASADGPELLEKVRTTVIVIVCHGNDRSTGQAIRPPYVMNRCTRIA
jgi:hypothetical protein